MNAINTFVDERVITRHLVSRPPSGPPPTHLYRETADQHHGGPANDLGTYVKRHLLEDQASPSSATAAVERPPPIEERREDENDATSKEHGGCEPQRREVREKNASKLGPETTRSMAQAWRQATEARSVLQSRGTRGRARARSRQRLCRYGQQPCRCAMDSSLAGVAAALSLWKAALPATGTAKDSNGLARAG